MELFVIISIKFFNGFIISFILGKVTNSGLFFNIFFSVLLSYNFIDKKNIIYIKK